MNNATLYNCCTDNEAPDWSQFSSLEISGCITDPSGNVSVASDVDAELWTVYGRMPDGRAYAITDCDTRALAETVAAELSALSKLPVD